MKTIFKIGDEVRHQNDVFLGIDDVGVILDISSKSSNIVLASVKYKKCKRPQYNCIENLIKKKSYNHPVTNIFE